MSIDFFYGYVAGLAVAAIIMGALAMRRRMPRMPPRKDGDAIGGASILFSFTHGTTKIVAEFQFPSSYEAALAYEDFKEAAEKRGMILIDAGRPVA